VPKEFTIEIEWMGEAPAHPSKLFQTN